MTPIELALLLGTVVGEAVLGTLAERGTDAVIDWCKNNSTKSLTLENEKELRALLHSNDASVWSVLKSELTLADRRGIVLVGPSGAGKTALWNFLTSEVTTLAPDSTLSKNEEFVRFASKYIKVVDTPGDMAHRVFHETFDYLQTGEPRLIIFVFACGYLDSGGLPGLRRPGDDKPLPDLSSYLDYARAEEGQWVKHVLREVGELKQKALDCLIVANKRDLWGDGGFDATQCYMDGSLGDDLRKLTSLWSVASPKVVHGVAADYNSFKSLHAPSAHMSRAASLLSLRLFRAQLVLRMKQIQT